MEDSIFQSNLEENNIYIPQLLANRYRVHGLVLQNQLKLFRSLMFWKEHE